MEQPPQAPFNLDSFIRQRAEEQRLQTNTAERKEQQASTAAPSPTIKKIPSPPLPATAEDDGAIDPLADEPISTATESSGTSTDAASEAKQKGTLGRETADTLVHSTHSARQSKEAAQEAAAALENEAEESQARLAAEAAQEAAQASLEAIEFAHQAARSAIEEASAGRKQKRTYNTHRLLVLLNISLLLAAVTTLTLFVWPGIQQERSPAPTVAPQNDKTSEHLTQQLLLDTQRERLRSEQELTLMERSLTKLVEEQQMLKQHLNETKDLLNSERERIQQQQTLDVTFQKMEQDLKQRIAELEKKLAQQAQAQRTAQPAAVPVEPVQQKSVPQPVTPTPQATTISDQREREVDEILQKLYSLHSELSEQKEVIHSAPAPVTTPAVEGRPYSYNRR